MYGAKLCFCDNNSGNLSVFCGLIGKEKTACKFLYKVCKPPFLGLFLRLKSGFVSRTGGYNTPCAASSGGWA